MVDIKKIIDEIGEECSPSFYIKQGIKERDKEVINLINQIRSMNYNKDSVANKICNMIEEKLSYN